MESTKTQALREQIAKLVDEYAAIALAPQPFLPGLTVVPPSGKVVGGTVKTFKISKEQLYC